MNDFTSTIDFFVCGPIISRQNYQIVAASLNELSKQLIRKNLNNRVCIVSYDEDIEVLTSSGLLNSDILLFKCADPGPDLNFFDHKKGFSNLTRLLTLGIEGLENAKNLWCLKTRVELLPEPGVESVEKYVNLIFVSLRRMNHEKQYSATVIIEHYAGLFNPRKAILAHFPDTWVLMKSVYLLKIYKRALEIWKNYTRTLQGLKGVPKPWLRSEQIFGRAIIELALGKSTDDFTSMYYFSRRFCFFSAKLEVSIIRFVSIYNFSFLGRVHNPKFKPNVIFKHKNLRFFGVALVPWFLVNRSRNLLNVESEK
jgi:hypothetical protein